MARPLSFPKDLLQRQGQLQFLLSIFPTYLHDINPVGPHLGMAKSAAHLVPEDRTEIRRLSENSSAKSSLTIRTNSIHIGVGLSSYLAEVSTAP